MQIVVKLRIYLTDRSWTEHEVSREAANSLLTSSARFVTVQLGSLLIAYNKDHIMKIELEDG